MYARIQDGRVAELLAPPDGATLAESFHPSIVAACVLVPPGTTVAVGDSYTDGTFAAPVIPLATLKAEAKAAAAAGLATRVAAGMAWAGKTLQIDETSQARMTASVLLAQQGLPPAAWRMADNSALPLDAPGLLAMATAAGAYVTALRAHYWQLVDLITAAANAASVASIDTTTGWPGEG